MCELEREETEGNIRMIILTMIASLCHRRKDVSLSVHFTSHVHCRKTWFFISCKGHRKLQECQEAGIGEELGAGGLCSPINKFRHAMNACLHNTSCMLLVSTRVRFWERNKYGLDWYSRCSDQHTNTRRWACTETGQVWGPVSFGGSCVVYGTMSWPLKLSRLLGGQLM